MAERNQFRSLFRGGDAGDPRNFQWIALLVLWKAAITSLGMATYARALALRVVTALEETSTIDTAPAALKCDSSCLFHALSITRILSPTAQLSRSCSATRKQFALASAGISLEPCHEMCAQLLAILAQACRQKAC